MRRDLEELETTRDALRPSAIAPRPALDLAAALRARRSTVSAATSYLAVEGPRGSTVLVVGDVVGHGRGRGAASRVRADLARHLRPVRGRPGAAAAAGQRRPDRSRRHRRVDYVTAACVVHRPADATLAWALAGHHAPLALDSGRELDRAGAGQPLGLDHELDVTGTSLPLTAEGGVLLYTDGILDARDEHGARFGEERLSALVGGVPRQRRPRGWWSICGWRSPTSRRRRATTSACSRRGTARRRIGDARRRR